MKSAKQLRLCIQVKPFTNKECEDMIKEYGRQCAENALKIASENATHDCEIDWIDFYDFSKGHNGMIGDIDRNSILNTKIETP